MRFLLIFFTTILLGACTATYQQTNVTDTPLIKLDPQGKILVATSKNGTYSTKNYQRSGQMTSQAIKASFDRHTNTVSITTACKSVDSCLDEANGYGYYTYLVFPEILHWEDRATEWSGKPDRIEIKLTLFSVENGERIHSTILSGRSKWVTFGGDHPQDLLPEAINGYISSLY